MGALLGLGLTHFPLLAFPDVGMAGALQWALGDPGLPEHLREPDQWPAVPARSFGRTSLRPQAQVLRNHNVGSTWIGAGSGPLGRVRP